MVEARTQRFDDRTSQTDPLREIQKGIAEGSSSGVDSFNRFLELSLARLRKYEVEETLTVQERERLHRLELAEAGGRGAKYKFCIDEAGEYVSLAGQERGKLAKRHALAAVNWSSLAASIIDPAG